MELMFNSERTIYKSNSTGEHVFMVTLFYRSIMIKAQQIVDKLFISVVVGCTQMHCA